MAVQFFWALESFLRTLATGEDTMDFVLTRPPMIGFVLGIDMPLLPSFSSMNKEDVGVVDMAMLGGFAIVVTGFDWVVGVALEGRIVIV